MKSDKMTVKEYLADLPAERRKAIEAVRKVVRANLDRRVKEGIQYGMIGYSIPHSVYPDGYHCNPDQPLPFLSLASQKSHMALYLFCIYGNEGESKRFEQAWRSTGKKLDMGKSCVRFKKLEEVPLDVVGEAIARMDVDTFIEQYEATLKAPRPSRNKAAKKKAAKKSVAKKSSARKTATKKTASKSTSRATKKST